ncbi:MAG TPA: putative sulfate exporter family transporter, partial [Steroidobacteraceae bacterium]|nr:putative sulfate exporter family transporter [Steroidobacteraceae bacterium]
MLTAAATLAVTRNWRLLAPSMSTSLPSLTKPALGAAASATPAHRRWIGVGLAAAVAGAGTVAAALPWAHTLGLSALTLSIVLGILVGNTVFPRIAPWAGPGVDFCKNTLLRAGVILYGFRISFGQLAEIGWAGVAIDIVMMTLVFTIAVRLGPRLFKLDRDTALLIG